jgi:Chaperone of endosialidase
VVVRVGLSARAACLCFAVTVVAWFSAGGVARSQCSDCTNFGTGSLASVITTEHDSAFGFNALNADTTGFQNTASGAGALQDTIAGSNNTATGAATLEANTGDGNTGAGALALFFNTTGDNNAATGANALIRNTTGSNNIAVGTDAGDLLTTGDNNIDIGNEGLTGESDTIRIGTVGTQGKTFLAGVYGSRISGPRVRPVVVNSSGRLGIGDSSSARYKRDIRDMGDASEGLLKLHPVTFRYNEDPDGPLQYGLIAEQVERVYPELVTYGDDGKVDGVRYESLPALLVSQAQKQASEIVILQKRIASQQRLINSLKNKNAQIDALAERMNALESQARLSKSDGIAAAAP